MKKILLILFFSLALIPYSEIFSQEVDDSEVQIVSETDLIIIFSISILAVIGIFLYIARHVILRKKTEYDKAEYESKKDRTYEKYHSEWTSDDYEFNKKSTENDFDKELRKKNLPNYYQILGISSKASKNEIKIRFRKLVKEWHPDKSKLDEVHSQFTKYKKDQL